MRKFNVTVNGNTYSVEVEEVNGSAAFSTAPVTESVKVAPAAAVPAPAAKAPVGGTVVKAPMPGNVLKLLKANGATVKNGEAILILEAMKMENPINASADGVVTYLVSEGASVETGSELAAIK